MTAADDSLEYFSKLLTVKIRLDISCKSSARLRIHMKHQSLFSSKDKRKKKEKRNKSVLCCNFS